jgi:hypothetical protein
VRQCVDVSKRGSIETLHHEKQEMKTRDSNGVIGTRDSNGVIGTTHELRVSNTCM